MVVVQDYPELSSRIDPTSVHRGTHLRVRAPGPGRPEAPERVRGPRAEAVLTPEMLDG